MTLRMRIFLLLGAVVAGLVLAQFWLLHALARDLSGEVGHVAFSVSESVLSTLAAGRAPAGADAARDASLPPGVVEREVIVTDDGRSLQIVSERVTVAPLGEPGAHADGSVVLRMAAPTSAPFVHLGGQGFEHRIPIPRTGIVEALDRFGRHVLAGSAALLLAGLLAAAVVAHRASAPVRHLAAAAREVGDGALGTQVERSSSGEMGVAIDAFNRMSARLEQLDAQARSAADREHLAELGEIARGLAHGLRNPLNGLGLSLDELASESGDAARRTSLAVAARRQIQRIDASIRSFLALAAADGGVACGEVDVLGLVQDVALEALHDAHGRVGVAVDPASDAPVVHGVAPELRAVMQALLVNAMEATPDGGRVELRVRQRPGGGAVVEILDEGPGLPDAVRERLFSPHVTTKAHGAGMGLYLAQRIVTRRHGGTLRLEPREPRGVRAVVELDASREPAHG